MHFLRLPLHRIPLLLLPVMILSGCGGKKDAVVRSPYTWTFPADARRFDGDSAMLLLRKQVELGPRAPGTAAHAACASLLADELRSRGMEVSLQDFVLPGYDGDTLRLRNIIGRCNPAAAVRVLLCAHWDSRPRADQEKDSSLHRHPIPGANDGASGVAVLLQLAAMLHAHAPAVGVDIVFFDGEDYGREGDEDMYLLGSRYYAASLGDARPVFGILLDLVGDRDAVFPREAISQQYAPDIVDLVWGAAARLGQARFRATEGSAILDDHEPLNRAGVKTVDIIDAELVGGRTADPRRAYWHTLGDTPAHCSPATLAAVGEVLAAVVYGLHPTQP